MSRADRQRQARDVTRRAILDAALELFVADGYPQVSIRNIAAAWATARPPSTATSSRRTTSSTPWPRRVSGCSAPRRCRKPPSADALEDIRMVVRRVYEFSKRQPQYFALVFLDRRVPRIGRESERFAFMLEIKEAIRSRMQRCIDEGLFPPSVEAQAGAAPAAGPGFRPRADAPVGTPAARTKTPMRSSLRHRDDDRGPSGGRGPRLRTFPEGDAVSSPWSLQFPTRGLVMVGGGGSPRRWLVPACRRGAHGAGRAGERPSPSPWLSKPRRGGRAHRAVPERQRHADGAGTGRGGRRGRGTRRGHAGRAWHAVAAGSVLVSVAGRRESMPRHARPTPTWRRFEARLGQPPTADFDVERVPEVAAARANRDLAKADFDRVHDALRAQARVEGRARHAAGAGRQRRSASTRAARNGVEQQRQALAGAAGASGAGAQGRGRHHRAGAVCRRRGRAAGVGGRLRDARHQGGHGDAHQPAAGRADRAGAVHLRPCAEGRPVALQVDAYPGQTFTGQVRYVSPGVRADSRALVVEAVVPNAKGLLKPGLFVTARIEQGDADARRAGARGGRADRVGHVARVRGRGRPRRGAHRHTGQAVGDAASRSRAA